MIVTVYNTSIYCKKIKIHQYLVPDIEFICLHTSAELLCASSE